MRDIVLDDTVYFFFTTRGFSDGVPATLSGTPVLSALEENNATPITAGVSVSVDRASVTGLNQATVVATTANGFEAGKAYALYISTGTVGGTSAVGEVVAEFTIQAAPVNWANVTGATTAVDLSGTDIQLADTVTTLTGHTAQTGDSYAIVNHASYGNAQLVRSTTPANTLDVSATGEAGVDWANVGSPTSTVGLSNTTVGTVTTNTDMRGTDSAALAATFTGITSLAEWLGALAGKQASDATAQTEMRATGAGSGTYDATTDSQEAQRDWVGDGTNLTEAGGTGDHLTAIDLPNQTMDITGSLSGSVGSVTGAVGSVTGNVGGNVVGSVGSLVGHTVQTGDNYARIGAPVGASISADIAAVQTDTDDIQTRLPAALVSGKMDSDATAISGDTTAADRLEAMMDGIIIAQVNDAAATTTAFAADGFTEATDDHFNGRLITFISGNLSGQQTDITDYDALGHAQGSQAFVVTALTEAPANEDFFVIH